MIPNVFFLSFQTKEHSKGGKLEKEKWREEKRVGKWLKEEQMSPEERETIYKKKTNPSGKYHNKIKSLFPL